MGMGIEPTIHISTSNKYNEAVVAQGHIGVIVTRRLWVRLNLISISSHWCGGKERRWVPPLNTRCLRNSAESGERSVWTLGSLCLSCCVREAWSWFIQFNFYKWYKNNVISDFKRLNILKYSIIYLNINKSHPSRRSS